MYIVKKDKKKKKTDGNYVLFVKESSKILSFFCKTCQKQCLTNLLRLSLCICNTFTAANDPLGGINLQTFTFQPECVVN